MKNTVLTIAIMATSLPFFGQAFALDTTINASLTLRKAISLQKVDDMNFGFIDYQNGFTGVVRLGSDGQVVAAGTGLTPNGGDAKPGRIGISGDDTSTAEVSCSATGIMGDGSGQFIPLTAIEYAINTGVPAGSGQLCGGIGLNPMVLDFSAQPLTTLLMGATANFNAVGPLTGNAAYATSAGGAAVTVRVVYQ